MTIFSLPYAPRRLAATEARLEAIYNAAKRGLRGDTLALAAGMRPADYRSLCEFDPLAALAEEKGRADGELEMSEILHNAAREGDAKAALDVLKHVHGWVAKHALSQEHSGPGGGPITLASVDLRNLSDAELESMQQLMAKATK